MSHTSTNSPVLLPAQLNWNSNSHRVSALLDTGAEECLIDQNLVRQLNIHSLDFLLTARALNGLTLAQVSKKTVPLEIVVAGNHREKLQFCVLANADPPLVLGLPWFRKHNPQLNWQTGEITSWSPSCIRAVFSLQIPRPQLSQKK